MVQGRVAHKPINKSTKQSFHIQGCLDGLKHKDNEYEPFYTRLVVLERDVVEVYQMKDRISAG